MTLAKIRTADAETLRQAVKELIYSQHLMPLGELHATTRTILSRGKEIGLDSTILNRWAQGHTDTKENE